jgi:hypothetical protein
VSEEGWGGARIGRCQGLANSPHSAHQGESTLARSLLRVRVLVRVFVRGARASSSGSGVGADYRVGPPATKCVPIEVRPGSRSRIPLPRVSSPPTPSPSPSPSPSSSPPPSDRRPRLQRGHAAAPSPIDPRWCTDGRVVLAVPSVSCKNLGYMGSRPRLARKFQKAPVRPALLRHCLCHLHWPTRDSPNVNRAPINATAIRLSRSAFFTAIFLTSSLDWL